MGSGAPAGLLLEGRRKSVEPMARGWLRTATSRPWPTSSSPARGTRHMCGRAWRGGCSRTGTNPAARPVLRRSRSTAPARLPRAGPEREAAGHRDREAGRPAGAVAGRLPARQPPQRLQAHVLPLRGPADPSRWTGDPQGRRRPGPARAPTAGRMARQPARTRPVPAAPPARRPPSCAPRNCAGASNTTTARCIRPWAWCCRPSPQPKRQAGDNLASEGEPATSEGYQLDGGAWLRAGAARDVVIGRRASAGVSLTLSDASVLSAAVTRRWGSPYPNRGTFGAANSPCS